MLLPWWRSLYGDHNTAGRPGDRIPVVGRAFSALHNVQTGSRAHPASSSVGTGVMLWVQAYSPGVKGLGREVNHLHTVPRLRMGEAIPVPPCLHAVVLFNLPLFLYGWLRTKKIRFDAMLSEMRRM